jgi:hypothetical protein
VWGIANSTGEGTPMDLQISDSLKRIPIPLEPVEKASALLENILGKDGNGVEARWDLAGGNNGSQKVRLKLKDYAGEVGKDFLLDDLRTNSWLYFDLSRLWGNLLHQRAEFHLAAIAETGE